MHEARKELKGKILGCWCSPYACHGEVLAEIANSDTPIESFVIPASKGSEI